MTALRCTGFDAGTTFAGYAVVEARNGRLYCLEGGHKHLLSDHPEDLTWLTSQIHDVMGEPEGFVVAEQIIKIYVHGPGMKVPDEQLIETKDQEGGIVWVARLLGAHVTRIPAVEWRAALGIRPPRNDAQVAVVVEYLYGRAIRDRFENATTRGHAYDALGLCAVALFRRLGVPIHLPRAVLDRLDAVRAEALAAGKAKKAALKLVPAITVALGLLLVADASALGTMARAAGLLQSDDTVVAALRIIARATKVPAPLRERAQSVLFASGVGPDPDARSTSRGQRERAKSARTKK